MKYKFFIFFDYYFITTGDEFAAMIINRTMEKAIPNFITKVMEENKLEINLFDSKKLVFSVITLLYNNAPSPPRHAYRIVLKSKDKKKNTLMLVKKINSECYKLLTEKYKKMKIVSGKERIETNQNDKPYDIQHFNN